MQWTSERTTWLGTYREKRGRWHHVPYVIRTHTTRGMTGRGWTVVAVAAVLMLSTVLVEVLVL